MFSKVYSATISGLKADVVNVETNISNGLPAFEMTGYLAGQIQEAKERIKVAIVNSGFDIRPQRIVVNISPAHIRKNGTGFDLPIAIGILAANGIIKEDVLKDTLLIGELSLNGDINGIKGIIACVIEAKENGIRKCIVPNENVIEGRAVKGMAVFGARNLKQVTDYLNSITELESGIEGDSLYAAEPKFHGESLDYLDVSGQFSGKRATMIAVAGMHNIIYVGPPGSGKTMLASRIPTIMPPMTFDEQMLLTKIYSVAGKLNKENPFIKERPFICPHHTISKSAFFGGGAIPVPGEITLAAKGVLFLDELTEFPSDIIESLRQPLEERLIRIVRLRQEYIFPADFMLVAAINPCKCGYYPDRNICNCSEQEIKRYLGKISQPMWDRFDICVNVEKAKFEDIAGFDEKKKIDVQKGTDEMKFSSEDMRKYIMKARQIQLLRFKNEKNTDFNSGMTPLQVKKYCKLNDSAMKVLGQAYDRLNMTARGYYKVLKVARTISDLEGKEEISLSSICEAISYRSYGE